MAEVWPSARIIMSRMGLAMVDGGRVIWLGLRAASAIATAREAGIRSSRRQQAVRYRHFPGADVPAVEVDISVAGAGDKRAIPAG